MDRVCGRYASTKSAADLADEFGALDASGDHPPEENYNVAPTDPVLSLVNRHPRDADGTADPARTERSIRTMRWGLIPHWAKDPGAGAKMINARAETVLTKAAFKTSVASRRCVLPADGWYEWLRGVDDAGKPVKQPFYMTRGDGSSLPLAGIWATWRPAPNEPLVISCAVLTTAAVGPLTEIHERMPLVLADDALADWLDPDSADVAGLLVPPSERLVDHLELRPVSTRVNSVRNNGPDLIARQDTTAPADLDQPSLF